jgi:hypothetical protein
MIVTLKHRLAVLAMPKTGSTAIEAALGPHADLQASGRPELKHMPLRKFDRFVRPLLDSYGRGGVETLCLFREPLDWLASWYRYRQRPELRDPARRTDGVDFAGFLEAYLAPEPPQFARVGRQAAFVRARQGGIGVDRIYRYEAFPAVAAFLSERLGESLSFPRMNVSPPRELGITPALRARAEAGLAEEYRIWREVARTG